MKKILFDLFQSQPAASSRYHGGGEYIKTVFKCLVENKRPDCEILVFYCREKFLDNWVLDIIRENDIREFDVSNYDDIYEIFNKEEIDIFYSGLPYYYDKNRIPQNVIVKGTIHGLRFYELPSDKYTYLYSSGKTRIREGLKYLFRNIYRLKKRIDFSNCIEMLDEIVCVSEYTKNTVRSVYPRYNNKPIEVLYSPAKHTDICTDENRIIEEKYILLIGGDRWIKNCYRELLALKNVYSKGYLEGYSVVVIGGLSAAIRKKFASFDILRVFDYVTPYELENLYKFCDVFLFASLNEGFGMTPLEAMRYGTTCIVSEVCSLPEVCGDAVYYVNPYDISDMADKIIQAADTKIDKKIIGNHFERIHSRQMDDLKKLSEFIMK